MRLAYDPQTNTIFDAATGAAVAVLYDDLPSEQRHALGRLMAAAEGMREALECNVDEFHYWIANPSAWDYYDDNMSEKLRKAEDRSHAALRAAEPPR